jgi:hypothetical protein
MGGLVALFVFLKRERASLVSAATGRFAKRLCEHNRLYFLFEARGATIGASRRDTTEVLCYARRKVMQRNNGPRRSSPAAARAASA